MFSCLVVCGVGAQKKEMNFTVGLCVGVVGVVITRQEQEQEKKEIKKEGVMLLVVVVIGLPAVCWIGVKAKCR